MLDNRVSPGAIVCNGVGWIFGPIAGAQFFYATDAAGRSTGSQTLWIPYAGVAVAVLSGRAHYYEGHSLAATTFPVRVLASMGVRDLLLTCAAGGVNRWLRPGDFLSFSDHINLIGTNPLRGQPVLGLPRFVDLTEAYDPGLAKLLKKSAAQCKIRLRPGVYLAVSGPSYETPAEIRAFERLGADGGKQDRIEGQSGEGSARHGQVAEVRRVKAASEEGDAPRGPRAG